MDVVASDADCRLVAARGLSWAAVIGMALWGVGFGAHDPLFRAAVAQRVEVGRRAAVPGVFNAVHGVAWCGISVLLGVLYDLSPVCRAKAGPTRPRLAASVRG